MTAQPDADAIIDAMAPLLHLDAAKYRAGVKTHLEVAVALADLLAGFPLGDEAEPAPVFAP